MSEFNAEFWRDIKEKYPKAYEKLAIFISFLKEIDTKDYYIEEIICYCDIEKFFREQCDLFIEFKFMYDPHVLRFDYIIINMMNNKTVGKCDKEIVNYNEAKFEAVKKAFAILNDQLENEK
jgi:hypothetical protein